MCGIIGVILDQSHAQSVKKVSASSPRVLDSDYVSDSDSSMCTEADAGTNANVNANAEVSHALCNGLFHLQHRGQDAWGTAVQRVRSPTGSPEVYIDVQKHMGLVRPNKVKAPAHNRVSDHVVGDLLPTTAGIGHVRYPTNSEFSNHSSQPFISKCGRIALCHNGNICNYAKIKENCRAVASRLCTGSDSEVLLRLLELFFEPYDTLTPALVVKAVQQVHRVCAGSYSVVCIIQDVGLVAFKDSHGIRPLVYGTRPLRQGSSTTVTVAIASESVALEHTGCSLASIQDVQAGELIIVDSSFLRVQKYTYAPGSVNYPCMFEWIYLSRDESIINGVSVYAARWKLGEALSSTIRQQVNIKNIDVVVPIPDTSRPYALAVSEKLDIPYRELITKNRYMTRSFIMKNNLERRKCLSEKFSVVATELDGKNILLVDDSIVRGNTIRTIIQKLRTTGVNHIYLASCCPPVKYPNVYGISIPSYEELLINQKSITEIEEYLGIQKCVYQTVEHMCNAVRSLVPATSVGVTTTPLQFELSVFTGKYFEEPSVRTLLAPRTF